MKIKEKLARDRFYYYTRPGSFMKAEDAIKDAYISGFEKCRALVRTFISETDGDPTGYTDDFISTLGEEECDE